MTARQGSARRRSKPGQALRPVATGKAGGASAGFGPALSNGAGWLAMLLLAAVAAAVYANTLGNGFVNDDEHLVLLNPWLESFRSVATIFGEDAWGFVPGPPIAEFYRPLMHLFYLVTYQLCGPRAWGFHLVNVLLHAANTILVYLLAIRWVGGGVETERTADRAAYLPGRWLPFVAALLFGVHPVHTEAVAWIAALPELAFSLFGLSALYLHAAPGAASPRRLGAAAALFLLALLAKETAITLLAIAVVQDRIVRRETGVLGFDGRRLMPFLGATGLYLLLRARVLTGDSIAASHSWNLDPAQWLLNVLALFADYLRLLLLPVDLLYWRPFRPLTSFATAEGLIALLVGLGFTGAVVLAWRRSKLAVLALAWIVAPLTPTFLLDRFPRTPFAERYLYLSVLGFALLVAMAWAAVARRRALRGVAAVTLVAVTAAYATATVARNQVWADAYTLFMDSVRKAPDTPRPPLALASRLVVAGRYDEALALHRILTALEPDHAGHHSAMAGALSIAGRSDEALAHFRKAVALRPDDPYHRNLLGIELARRGELDEARRELEAAVRLAPQEPVYRNNLERLGALAR